MFTLPAMACATPYSNAPPGHYPLERELDVVECGTARISELSIVITITMIQRIFGLNIFPPLPWVSQWNRQSGGSRRLFAMCLFHFQTEVREGLRICVCDKTRSSIISEGKTRLFLTDNSQIHLVFMLFQLLKNVAGRVGCDDVHNRTQDGLLDSSWLTKPVHTNFTKQLQEREHKPIEVVWLWNLCKTELYTSTSWNYVSKTDIQMLAIVQKFADALINIER